MVELADSEMALFDMDVAVAAASRDVIEAVGPDAADYLHGQLSQDVTGLTIGSSAMTLLLQPQGKIDAWMRLSRTGDNSFWLDVEPGFGQLALDRLLRFKLRVDAELTLSTRPITAVRGPRAAEGPARLGIDPPEDAIVLNALWPGVEGFDVFAPIGSWIGPSVPEVSADALDSLRIRSGIPAMGSELDASTIPAAAGIVDASVDFTKGCYVGQELVARIDSRGSNTPSRLCGLRSQTVIDLRIGTPVVVDDQEVGTVTSVAAAAIDGSTIGLLYLKRSVAVPASATSRDGRGEIVGVDLVGLPFG